MKPQIDYKSQVFICDCFDEIHTQRKYLLEGLTLAVRDIDNDKANIDLDLLVDLIDFLGEDLPRLTEKSRDMAKKMENKLREYKAEKESKELLK